MRIIDLLCLSACFNHLLDHQLSHDLRYILVVNYWDSTMTSIPIDEEGLFLTDDGTKSQIPGNNAEKKREAHGNDPHSKHRFDESHAHACVFDPTFGRMAFVPDLGEGVIKQFAFDENNGSARYCGTISCGAEAGPRYMEFHPQMDVCTDSFRMRMRFLRLESVYFLAYISLLRRLAT